MVAADGTRPARAVVKPVCNYQEFVNISVVPFLSASYFSSVRVNKPMFLCIKADHLQLRRPSALIVTIKSSFFALGGMSEQWICHLLGKFVKFYFIIIDIKDISSKLILNRVIKQTETLSKRLTAIIQNQIYQGA